MISSRLIFDRATRGETALYSENIITSSKTVLGSTHDLGAICRKPAELTAFRRLRRDTKAELCGKSIKIPYKHLKRYGYRSGSRS